MTIDDVDAFSQEINRIEDGVATRIGMIPWQTYGFGNSIYTWGWAFGGSFYDEANEEVTPDDEHIVAALQWMVDTAKAVGGPDQVSVTPPGLQVHYFGGGNVGMSPMVSVNFRDVKRYNPDLQIGQGLGCIRDFCISPWDRGRLARTPRSWHDRARSAPNILDTRHLPSLSPAKTEVWYNTSVHRSGKATSRF